MRKCDVWLGILLYGKVIYYQSLNIFNDKVSYCVYGNVCMVGKVF